MEELDLYKFCEDKEMDWRGEKLILWVSPYDIEELAGLIGDNYLSDGGYDVTLLQYGQLGIELNGLCEDFGIEPERIHPNEESKSA